MSYRSPNWISDKSLIFRETFSSEQEVRRNGGVPTNAEFLLGRFIGNGASSKVVYADPLPKYSPWSIRIRFKTYAIGAIQYLWHNFGTSGGFEIFIEGGGIPACRFQGVGDDHGVLVTVDTWHEIVIAYNGTGYIVYQDKVQTDTRSSVYNGDTGDLYVGSQNTDAAELDGEIELIEIYNKDLSQVEIENLYNNARYVVPSLNHGEQLGPELVTSLVNSTAQPCETAVISGRNITSAINTSGNGSIYDNVMNLSVVAGERYRLEFDFVLNSGASPNVLILEDGENIAGTTSNIINPTTGSYSEVLTITATGTGRELGMWENSPFDYSMTNISLKKILVERTSPILHVTAQRDGIARNLFSGDTILGELVPDVVNTDIEIAKEGSIYTPRFNGNSSKIDAGDYNSLIGDLTVLAWVKIKDISSSHTLFYNGQFRLYQIGASFYIRSNNLSTGRADNVFVNNEVVCLGLLRLADGTVEIYINGVEGTTDPTTATPVAGSENMVIGAVGASGWWDSDVPEVIIISGLATPEEISQYFSSTKKLYQK